MPKPAKEYRVLETGDLEKASRFISFPVIRLPVFCEFEGRRISLPKEAIFRKDDLKYFETLSPGYGIIEHASAFAAMAKAIGTFRFQLKTVILDQNGALLLARFQFENGDSVVGDDSVKAEITLVNSYNGETGLGLNLGAFREQEGNRMFANFKSRWMHLGNQANAADMRMEIEKSLYYFNKQVVPLYREMAHTIIPKELVMKILGLCVKRDILPKKLSKQIISHITLIGTPLTAWGVFNVLTWSTTHAFRGSPTRLMEIEQKIAKSFKDGGKQLIIAAQNLSNDLKLVA